MVFSLLLLCTTISLKAVPALTKAIAESSDLANFINETDSEMTSSQIESSTQIPSSTMNPSTKLPSSMRGKDLHCPSIENAVSSCPKGGIWINTIFDF